MKASWSSYNIATYGLGPEMLKGAFARIDVCLTKAENLYLSAGEKKKGTIVYKSTNH